MAITREVAWRVFSGEFNTCTHKIESSGERAPSYILSPLGAKINRVYAVGVLTDVENIGTDTEPFWRARVSDPTGIFYLSAGQYDPEGAKALAKIEPPTFVAIVGKSRMYSPEEGITYISLRPETVKEVDNQVRNRWILEVCESMKRRIEVMRDAKEMEDASVEKLVALGHKRSLAENAVLAIKEYQYADIEKYSQMLVESLRYLVPEGQDGKSFSEREDAALSSKPREVVQESREPEEEDKTDEGDDVLKAPGELEDRILEVIIGLEEGDSGAGWDKILLGCQEAGIDKEVVEEGVNDMLEKGIVYEPVLGKIKRVLS